MQQGSKVKCQGWFITTCYSVVLNNQKASLKQFICHRYKMNVFFTYNWYLILLDPKKDLENLKSYHAVYSLY